MNVTSAPDASPETVTAAATIVLLRPTYDAFELLLVERHGKAAFAGGALVFPGGRVDADDAAIALNPSLAIGFDALATDDASARIAAARETFEEAGILVSDGPALDQATRDRWREGMNSGNATFAAFLATTRHRLDAAALVPFAHWVPPETVRIARRFDTRFYLAVPAHADVASADGGETVAAHWLSPAEVLARADAGAVSLVFPTRRTLERLAQYATLDDLVTASRARPLTRIQPEIVTRDGTQYLTIPAGCDYPVTEEALTAVRRE